MKRVLITGAAGFIGYHLAKRMLGRDDIEVTLLDNLNEYYDVRLKHDRLADLESLFADKYHFVQADLTDQEAISKLFADERSYDAVINLAAQAGVRYAKENPRVYLQSNVDGFFTILDEARKSGCMTVIYASSSSVYGGNESIPFKETDKCANPLSVYAASKLSNEMFAESYANTFGMTCVGLRFFNVYGPWGRPDAVYYKWSDALTKQEAIELRDGGELFRDMTYVDDVTLSIERLLSDAWRSVTDTSSSHQVYNIGNENPVKMGDLLTYLSQKFNVVSDKIIVAPRGAEEPVLTRASTDKLKQRIDYAPNTPYQTGIDTFIDWYRHYYAT